MSKAMRREPAWDEGAALALAKRVLSLDEMDEESPIPKYVIEAMREWLASHPRDDNFVLELDPGRGTGTATCMEEGCWMDIQLESDSGVADGGLAKGLGSLEALAIHCSMESHTAARDARWKAIEQREARRLKLQKTASGSAAESTSQSKRLAAPDMFSPERKPRGSQLLRQGSGSAVWGISLKGSTADKGKGKAVGQGGSGGFGPASPAPNFNPTSHPFSEPIVIESSSESDHDRTRRPGSPSKRSAHASGSTSLYNSQNLVDESSDDDVQFLRAKKSLEETRITLSTPRVNEEADVQLADSEVSMATSGPSAATSSTAAQPPATSERSALNEMINRYNQESRIIGALPRFTSSATTATLSHALVRDRVVHLQKCKNDFKRRGAATLQPPSQALIRLVPQLSQIWSQISLFSASVPDTTKNHRQSSGGAKLAAGRQQIKVETQTKDVKPNIASPGATSDGPRKQAERKKFLDRLRAELAVLSCLRRRVSDQSIMSLVDSRTNLLEQYLNMEDADGTIPKVAQPPRQLMQLDSMLSNIWPEAEASPGRNVVAEGKPTLNTASATLSVPSTPLDIARAKMQRELAAMARLSAAVSHPTLLTPGDQIVITNRLTELSHYERCLTIGRNVSWPPPQRRMMQLDPSLTQLYPTNTASRHAVAPLGHAQHTAGAGFPCGYSTMPGGYPAMPGEDLPPELIGLEAGGPADLDLYGRGHYDDVETREFFTNALKDFQENITVNEAAASLGLESTTDQLSGMNVALMPHQVIGVDWMIKKERDPKWRGGILADEMGLGKTVQSLACCMLNQSADPKLQTTLIICPMSLMSNWREEILSKTDGSVSVLIHHGPGRATKRKILMKYNFVITTYGTLVSEFAHLKKETRKRKRPVGLEAGTDDEAEAKEFVTPKKPGPLATMPFFRVICDEAHQFRNRSTKVARAIFELQAVLRWALTGTIIVNGLADAFPLLHYLDVSSLKDWEKYNHNIVKLSKHNPKLASKRLRAVLQLVCLRRQKSTLIDGAPILRLPEKTIKIEEMDFDDEEVAIYAGIEAKARLRFNKYLREGTVIKHYFIILVMLTRLRQACCHPKLIIREKAEHPDDMPVLGDGMDEAISAEILHGVESRDEVRALAARLGGEALVVKLDAHLLARKTALARPDVKAEANMDDADDLNCPICLEAPYVNECVSPCLHSFCKTCIADVLAAPMRQDAGIADADYQRGLRPCPLCRQMISADQVFPAAAFMPPPTKDEQDDKEELRQAMAEINAGQAKLEEMNELGDDELPLSTKMRRTFEMVEDWLANEEGKIILFTSFVSLIEIFSKEMDKRGINHILYTGGMRRREREDNIHLFKNASNDTRVALISTKAGGVGLNLTVANKVVSLDMAWNEATERQAWDRAHRIGQTRPVTITRLMIRDTVEQRILALQQKKQGFADAAFGEGDVRRALRLTVGDLTSLFNSNAAVDSDDEMDD